ncbi:MAG: hypothetical protein V2J14_04500 [Erythrobacter sp.]|nr:hypothetical protein [Erythrobacter sp.]
MVRSHWFWFAAILTVASGLDYWDHISRPGSAFAQAPGAWFGFTFASTVSLWLAARATAWALERFARFPDLAAATLGVAHAVCVHLVLTGPLWGRVFWTGGLGFDGVAVPVLVAAGLYLAFRGVLAAVLRLADGTMMRR